MIPILVVLLLMSIVLLVIGTGSIRIEKRQTNADAIGADPEYNIGSSITDPSMTSDITAERAPAASVDKNRPPAYPLPGQPGVITAPTPAPGAQPGAIGRSQADINNSGKINGDVQAPIQGQDKRVPSGVGADESNQPMKPGTTVNESVMQPEKK